MPETEIQPEESRMKKYGPVIFWGAILALPAMNMGAAVFNYKTVQVAYATELLKSNQQ